jgi:hypothetical protein
MILLIKSNYILNNVSRQNSPESWFKENVTLQTLWTQLYHKEAHYW